MSTAGCGGQSVSLSNHERAPVSATSKDVRKPDPATRDKNVQQLSAVSTLNCNRESVERYMLHDRSDAVDTGVVLSTRVEVAKVGICAFIFAELRI